MNKQDIYKYLKENNIWHEITEHKAVYNMAELAEVDIPYPEADAKNLFVRDDKKEKLLSYHCSWRQACQFKRIS